MAINPFLMLSGIGMILIAVFSILYWRHKTKVKTKFFLAGAGIWIIAIIIKILMDLTITFPLQQGILAVGGLAGLLVGASVYVGLRTGLLESGLSYFGIIKTELKKMTYKEAVAFGIGFGAFEALIIGFSSFLNILIFVLMPEIVATIPVEYQAGLIQQLSASSLFILPALIERIAATFMHIFAAVLVVYAIRSKQLKYLWYSVAYKTVVDGIVPVLVFALSPATSLVGAYIIEIPIIILGAIGFYGTLWVSKKKWQV
jgi:uncharacterized membrane protein YhfC